MSRKLEGCLLKGGRAHDKRVQAQTISFRRPHAKDAIQPVVFILIMVCHDRVGAGFEVREFHNGRSFRGLCCLNLVAPLFIGKRIRRIEEKNADRL